MTLLLRRDVLPIAIRFNDYSSYYEDSEIDLYLNSVYIKELETIDDSIITVPIEITSDESIGSAGDDTMQIQRRIFLLSYSEVGLSPSPTTSQEGNPIEYFKNPSNRIAYCDKEHGRSPTGWFLRTPNTYFESAVYSIGPNGEIGTGNANNENGIRPAMCIKSDTKIKKADFAKGDDHAYVIAQ